MAGNERQITVQTVAWFIDLRRKGQLDLSPPYQRRSVWNQPYREYFIDTILNRFPMPPVFLHRQVDEEGNNTYHVVDGRQRLESLIAYTSNEFATPASFERHAGSYFKDLPVELKKEFWDYLVPVEFLPDTNENQLKDIFDRINRNVAQLKPQELRHARFSGEFLKLTERLAERLAEQLPHGFPNILEADRRRMRDVEYVATLVLYFERGPQGTSQSDLDNAYSNWDEALPELDLEGQFIRTLAAIAELAGVSQDLPRSRYRNLADFYSLFAAVGDLLPEGWRPAAPIVEHMLEFARRVEMARTGETRQETDPEAHAYYEAARAASNDAGPRQARIQTLKRVLRAEG